MKKVVVLGGGGFIGGHLAKRLKDYSNWVRICDIKRHEYFDHSDICHEFIVGDLRDPKVVSTIIDDTIDEVYQLAADTGGASYILTGENDADIMYNSALINLNVLNECVGKKIKKVFYASSGSVYSNTLNFEESSIYPANPESEHGWEKIFSERLFLSFKRNYGLNVKIGRLHTVFGPQGTWDGGKENVVSAICRKTIEAIDGEDIEVWGDGTQERSFMYVDDCVTAILKLMDSEFSGPVNIGSEELITINKLAQMVIDISEKNSSIYNLRGDNFWEKYGFSNPLGVRRRNSNNILFKDKVGWEGKMTLLEGIKKTYEWISEQSNETKWIFESPDGGKTVTKRKMYTPVQLKIVK